MHTVATNITQEHTHTHRREIEQAAWESTSQRCMREPGATCADGKGCRCTARQTSSIHASQQARQRQQDTANTLAAADTRATSTAKRQLAGVSNSCCTPCFQLRHNSVPSTLVLGGSCTQRTPDPHTQLTIKQLLWTKRACASQHHTADTPPHAHAHPSPFAHCCSSANEERLRLRP